VPYRLRYHCSVVKHIVAIEGEENQMPGSHALSPQRTMTQCSGSTECGVFPKPPIIRPVRCPYFNLIFPSSDP
jgi:hypothetical protein